MKSETDMLMEFLQDNNIANYDEICLVTNINGYNEKSMYDILEARTTYSSIEQCIGEYDVSEELLEYLGLDESEDEEDDDEIEEDD